MPRLWTITCNSQTAMVNIHGADFRPKGRLLNWYNYLRALLCTGTRKNASFRSMDTTQEAAAEGKGQRHCGRKPGRTSRRFRCVAFWGGAWARVQSSSRTCLTTAMKGMITRVLLQDIAILGRCLPGPTAICIHGAGGGKGVPWGRARWEIKDCLRENRSRGD